MVGEQRKTFTLSRLKQPETPFFTFLSYWKTPDLHIILEYIYKKIIPIMWNSAYMLKKMFLKHSTNQTFTFVSSKVVYSNKHLASIAPSGNGFSTVIKCSVLLPCNYTCSRSNGEAIPNLIKRRLEKSAIWVYLKRNLK